MVRSFVDRNEESRARLRRVVEALTDEDGRRPAGDGWTVAALLGHIAHWDRFVAVRWRRSAAIGAATPEPVPDAVADLINDAALPTWAALPASVAGSLAVAAAEEVDGIVARLSDVAVAAVVEDGRSRLVDRSLHRAEHLDLIDRALERRQPS